ncbi:MAG: VanZ family protein [Lachnospiraceae bacterium]|uniref:VanZ family protein n=1 Tax=Candidatus Weimeria bifida TaxID=2599074 RepID=A0A6N7J343_9FIRM|nr:VanZ family protein [Candidatus Weimeria bifida]RRF95905.1 MAG: VanZ family protein [Lachnospiraceae bacterium]
MKKKILTVLIVLTLAFIWGHSMVPKTYSAEESGRFLKLLKPFLSLFLDPKVVTDHLIRKMAHFTEYMALGMEIRGLIGIKSKEGLNVPVGIFHTSLIQATKYVFFAAFLDETIQIFSHRGSMISDVWLDTCGGFCGALIITLIIIFIEKKKRRRS